MNLMRGASTLTIADSAKVTLNKLRLTTTQQTTGPAVVHLDGGTLSVGMIDKGNGSYGEAIYFNGGTLKATSDNATFLNFAQYNSFNLPDFPIWSLYVQDGGAIVDDGGFAIGIPDLLPLQHYAGATTDSLTKNGSGTLTLTAANTYSGGTTINAGTLRVKKAASLPGYATQTVAVNGTSTLLVNAGAGSPTEWDATEIAALLGNANATFAPGATLGIDTTGGDLAYGSNSTKANLGLTKLGAHTLTLSGANTYTGNTTIAAGTLSIASTGALPGWDTSGRYSVASGAALAVGNAVTDGNITTMLNTGNFAAGANLGFETSAGNREYTVSLANPASGAIGLVKIAANTLTLSGANTYSGLTDVQAGELDLNTAANNSISGNLQVSGGTAKLLRSNQIDDGKTVAVNGGTLAMQSFDDAVAGVVLAGGAITGTGGALTSTTDFDVRSGSVSAIFRTSSMCWTI